MNVTLAISPCPNDTFIFGAIVLKYIDLGDYEFDVHFGDVEELNHAAAKATFDITKISFNAFADVTSNYVLLKSGAALGRGCGPLLLSKGMAQADQIKEMHVAIPGVQTTANFLLDFYTPVKKKTVLRFDEIEDAVLAGEVDAGVAIHENRFTYRKKGLSNLMDLGQHWESHTGHPIPLGGIVARRSFDRTTLIELNALIRRSLEFAYDHPDRIFPFIQSHAQEMDRDVMQNHIDLYVNDYTNDLGHEGVAAIHHFLNTLAKFRSVDLQQPILH